MLGKKHNPITSAIDVLANGKDIGLLIFTQVALRQGQYISQLIKE